jgi:hypothetical protein
MVLLSVIYVNIFTFVELLVRQQRQIRNIGDFVREMHLFDTSEKYLEGCSV